MNETIITLKGRVGASILKAVPLIVVGVFFIRKAEQWGMLLALVGVLAFVAALVVFIVGVVRRPEVGISEGLVRLPPKSMIPRGATSAVVEDTENGRMRFLDAHGNEVGAIDAGKSLPEVSRALAAHGWPLRGVVADQVAPGPTASS